MFKVTHIVESLQWTYGNLFGEVFIANCEISDVVWETNQQNAP